MPLPTLFDVLLACTLPDSSAIAILEIHGSPQFTPPSLVAAPRDTVVAWFNVGGRMGQPWTGTVTLDDRCWSLWATVRCCGVCDPSHESNWLIANTDCFVCPPWRCP